MSGHAPTVLELLARGEIYLRKHGVPNARRNAEWILSHTLSRSVPALYLSSQTAATRPDADRFDELVKRRGTREPLQYVLGTTEFMSLPFRMAPGVFIPRPDTEVLVEIVEAKLSSRRERARIVILDLCCGSGVIAVSLARRLNGVYAAAVDISRRAVELTEENARLNGVSERVHAVAADAAEFLSRNRSPFDAVVCNPPYVRSDVIDLLSPEIKCFEPRLGLDGGNDGQDFYRQLCPLLRPHVAEGGLVAFEIAETQGEAVASSLEAVSFTEVTVHEDYNGLDRVVTARAPGVLSSSIL